MKMSGKLSCFIASETYWHLRKSDQHSGWSSEICKWLYFQVFHFPRITAPFWSWPEGNSSTSLLCPAELRSLGPLILSLHLRWVPSENGHLVYLTWVLVWLLIQTHQWKVWRHRGALISLFSSINEDKKILKILPPVSTPHFSIFMSTLRKWKC